MPYELVFSKRVTVENRDEYFNDCCIGGDIVLNQLLPSVRDGYTDVETNQEDWGWFIWFRHGDVKLAIDVFTDDADAGAFRIHLTSRRRRFLLADRVVDSPELEDLREFVVSRLTMWVGGPIGVTHLDRNYQEDV